MGDRLLEGRAAQRLVASLAPPFDREIVETCLGEMMRDGLGLGGRVAQLLPGPAMQRLPAALEQALVGRIPDQRVLEAVARPRRRVLDEQDVGLGEPFQGGLEAGRGGGGRRSRYARSRA